MGSTSTPIEPYLTKIQFGVESLSTTEAGREVKAGGRKFKVTVRLGTMHRRREGKATQYSPKSWLSSVPGGGLQQPIHSSQQQGADLYITHQKVTKSSNEKPGASIADAHGFRVRDDPE